jgi:hypothetical protein
MFNLHSRKSAAMVVVVDFLLAVLLMQQAILSLTTINKNKTPPRIETLGVYVIKVTWPEKNADDVDTYVESPTGNLVYFANSQSGLMHLERDDLGEANDVGLKGVANQERVILRGTEVGEYIVNVHMYHRYSPGQGVKVHVELWRLRGGDKLIYSRDVVLYETGDEKTAFRFSLDANQRVTDINQLPKSLVSTVA